MATELTNFPHGCVRARVRWWTENLLGSLPMVLVTPLVASVLATVLAVSQPSEAVRHGRVVSPSFLTSLGLALGGGVGGIAAVVTLSILCVWLRYWISGYQDPKLESVRTSGQTALITLQGRRGRKGPAPTVSALEAFVRGPQGVVHHYKGDETSDGIVLGQPPAPGAYEVRWYGQTTRHARYEITRQKLIES